MNRIESNNKSKLITFNIFWNKKLIEEEKDKRNKQILTTNSDIKLNKKESNNNNNTQNLNSATKKPSSGVKNELDSNSSSRVEKKPQVKPQVVEEPVLLDFDGNIL